MSNVGTGPVNCPDSVSLKKPAAANDQERRLALNYCINIHWSSIDIGRLERVDDSSFHGWQMWR
jgi:hypothetical protein